MSEEDQVVLQKVNLLWQISQLCLSPAEATMWASQITKELKNYPKAVIRFNIVNGQPQPVFVLGEKVS